MLLSKQLVRVWDFWAVWSCVYLLHVFFTKILVVLFVTQTVGSAIPQSMSESMGWERRGCCLQLRGAALFCWAPKPRDAGVPCSCRSCWGALLTPLAVPGEGRCPEYTNVVLTICCPNQSSDTAWRAEELCTPQKSVINCRVKGVSWLLSVNYQFLLQFLWGS